MHGNIVWFVILSKISDQDMQLNQKMHVFGKKVFPTKQNLSKKMANQEMHIPRPQHECLCQLSVLRLQLLYCVSVVPHID